MIIIVQRKLIVKPGAGSQQELNLERLMGILRRQINRLRLLEPRNIHRKPRAKFIAPTPLQSKMFGVPDSVADFKGEFGGILDIL